MSSGKKSQTGNLIWLDLEMTGLEPDTDEILEVAIVVTNRDLEIVDQAKPIVLACAEEKLAAMDSWNKSTHGGSGLLAEVKISAVGYEGAERDAYDFVSSYAAPGESPMCGNTICQDRRFLARRMRKLHDYFHYRNLDVSSFKIASSWWLDGFQRDMPQFRKNAKHRALSDILDSIEEMRYYRSTLF